MIKKPKTDPVACSGSILALLDALDVLGGKWRLLIVHYLMTRRSETNTFKKIEKDIEGISAKMLSKELKMLEANLTVHREVLDTKPITVSYYISEYGLETRRVIEALVTWGQNHRQRIFLK